MDASGNVYYMVRLHSVYGIISEGTIPCNNVNERWVREQGVHVDHEELPIREFNRQAKGLPSFGCKWEDIQYNLFNNDNMVFNIV